jgi:transposase
LHAHTTEEIAYDLGDALATYRKNRAQGMDVKPPWREKKYRPLSFSSGYGWRASDDRRRFKEPRLRLSLGKSEAPIWLALPKVVDSSTALTVGHERWGEVKLCWDRDARAWSLHVAYRAVVAPVPGDPGVLVAVDEGIINPMALAVATPIGFDVLVIGGRQGRAIRHRRNKSNAKIQKLLSETKPGSRRHKHLVRAKKANQARTARRLRDFDHQVSRKAADFVTRHKAGRVVVGDVRGIEANTRKEHRPRKETRQELSQWRRSAHESYLHHKTGIGPEHVNERLTTKTCPACGARNRPKGRDYRCRVCGFRCHRDAVGAINILMIATHGELTPIGPDQKVRTTYLRAVKYWSTDQSRAHSNKVLCQRRQDLARVRSTAENPARPF